ncbi:MAG: N-acetylmuramic acid 6-phosphate etherase [Streptococcaceae bacterium]|jgi:N-acetylmuramic acid 6-phosphate etherase|nr:N-acetylmuramic acid 6-phosphate etherase [Streptococcaceae bacterium]
MNLESLGTEQRNPSTMNLDELSIEEALFKMNAEDQKVAMAVKEVLPDIEKVVQKVIETFNQGGRLIYIGAGTSGRLGILDAAECVPTFGVTSEMVIGVIAGGNEAMTVAVEGAEDSLELGRQDLVNLILTDKDYVIGIAASGRTPYVIGALNYAKSIGSKTAALSCNKNAEISQIADLSIEVNCGAEFLTGSTRLKSGTAQKLVLNMISTVAMIGIGKVYGNLMVDVKATNIKLVERAKQIIMAATSCDYQTASKYFMLADKNAKVAIVMILTNTSKAEAEEKLIQGNNFIKNTISI